jgi:hypothetical protein
MGRKNQRPSLFASRSVNWWVTKIVSLIALFYLISSLNLSFRTHPINADSSSIKTEHIILFAVILLFNSDFVEKLESFSFGDLGAKFATKEEVNRLEGEIDTLLVGTILDSYEYITLQKVSGKREDRYAINPSGLAQLERLVNRGLIEEKSGSSVFQDKTDRSVALRDYFLITPKGEGYLEVVDSKELGSELERIASRIGYKNH